VVVLVVQVASIFKQIPAMNSLVSSRSFRAAHTHLSARGNGGWGGKPTRSTITIAGEPASVISKAKVQGLLLKAPAAMVCVGLGAALAVSVGKLSKAHPTKSYDSTSIVTL